ncbi:MAG: hypothetical protein EPO19_10920 [Betaproteobacteria bacterium]|nr:MAG: hypothetical protein EPO19_10920 [Betaproteobacteria bacterium]
MNDVTKSIVDAQRGGKNPEWVFPYQGRAIAKMNDSARKKARVRAATKWQEEMNEAAPKEFARVHDLKHYAVLGINGTGSVAGCGRQAYPSRIARCCSGTRTGALPRTIRHPILGT